ncbi:FIMAH domain-containing protein [Virgibacillus phasianinus]|uniref:FIMAH domain-containing protein n=1 Tax=Virgibacillus phasianinus TaxID=2017483 RepID=UPI003CCBA2D6
MKTLVVHLEEEGVIEADTARALKMHLTAVIRYEEEGLANKVVKHMKGFNVLLKHQEEQGMIPEKAYKHLKADTNALIAQWQ